MGRLTFYIVATAYMRRGRRNAKLRGQDVLRRLFVVWVWVLDIPSQLSFYISSSLLGVEMRTFEENSNLSLINNHSSLKHDVYFAIKGSLDYFKLVIIFLHTSIIESIFDLSFNMPSSKRFSLGL